MSKKDIVSYETELCVVGGGMAGIAVALTAARQGVKTVLMHDRPVLGGNASSECRVHICGADRHNTIPHLRETGILEELRMENLHRNPQRSFSIWDSILYEKTKYQEDLTLLLNCSCLDAEMDGNRIVSVKGWQATTYSHIVVKAKIFVDCSGDGVLVPLTNAEFRVGREAKSEFGEASAPEVADRKTMGMTCLFQSREHATPQPFEAPKWAHKFEKCEELPYGAKRHEWLDMGYWWIELGGVYDSIKDTEKLRDELLKLTFGVWDHMKNHCPDCSSRITNRAIEWLQFLPAKRESRRYIGDHMLTQCDIEKGGQFQDTVAYGGWAMDDHHPEGFWAVRSNNAATIFHKTPSPYGIPYRSLYSKNVANLMFAGRVASCTHMAMSSTRVMGTGFSMGQAVGFAAAIALKNGLDPRAVQSHMDELQQVLLDNDCWLPNIEYRVPEMTRKASLKMSREDCSPEPVRDGITRQIGSDPHCVMLKPGDWVAYEFKGSENVSEVILVFDSAMDCDPQMSYHNPGKKRLTALPKEMPRTFCIDGCQRGKWNCISSVEGNINRFVRIPINRQLDGVRFRLEKTYGATDTRLYGFYVK